MPSEILSERKIQGGSLIPVVVVNDESDPIPVEIVSPIELENFISLVNTTHGPLDPGETFVGDSEDILTYTTIVATIFSSQDSATGGLEFQFSNENLVWWTSDAYTYSANSRKVYSIQRQAQYFRLSYTNGSVLANDMDIHCIFNSTAGVHSSHRVGDVISDEDDAILNKAVLSGKQPVGTQINIKATAEGELKTSVVTPVGSLPVSQLTTLHDGKILNRLFPELMEESGTGTGTFQTNKYNMSVGVGEWKIYSSRRFYPYYAGKPQKVELTFDKFAPEADVIKRVGYSSSNTASPYDADYDGFYLESSGGTILFVLERAGTTIFSTDITAWDGYDILGDYQNLATWDNFTVIEFNFLWLGGAYIELRLVTDEGFTTVHQFIYAGTSQDVFMQSPNQTVRYEIRSSTGTGEFRYICNQVATSGSIQESGYGRSVDTGAGSAIALTGTGTKKAVLGIRKQLALRYNSVKIIGGGTFVTSNDTIFWTIEINPTISTPIIYGDLSDSAIQFGNGSNSHTVTTNGIIVTSGFVGQEAQLSPSAFQSNYLSYLSGSITGVQDEYVLTVTPISNNIAVYANLNFLEG